MFCPQCRLEQPTSHVYCARCGTPLPVDLVEPAHSKATRWFPGIKVGEEREQGYLRVSCYREDQVFDAPEGSVTIPGHHVRFSIWIDDHARCALSIPESEALELASFIAGELRRLNDARVSR